MNRRTFTHLTVTAAATLPFLKASAAAPQAQILETKTISWQSHLYHGWPTLTQRANGELWLAWSGGRESHICPFGQLCVMSSLDGGVNWTYPRVLQDGPLDDRDGGVVETAQGTLLVTSFTSTAFLSSLEKERKANQWPTERRARWEAAAQRTTEEQKKTLVGQWLTRSTDGGVSWSSRIPTPVSSPHGPKKLKDGRLLYAGKELFTDAQRAGLCESKDDGLTWEWIADIPLREGDDPKQYHEFDLVEAANGTLIWQVRNHNKANHHETLQSESTDGGKTWTPLHSIGVWGLPSHLLLLKDGRLLMSYGHRRAPLGNQARISSDHGKTWSDPILVSSDATSGDLGYPSTVELADGTLLTVWYEVVKGNSHAVLRQARWKLL